MNARCVCAPWKLVGWMGHRVSRARERVLEVAEGLFMTRGYAAVTMHDIASDLGMKQASLYYHAPGGKEELFVEILERGLSRHKIGLLGAIQDADEDVSAQLHAAAAWFTTQPPLQLMRMARSDIPALSEAHAERLMYLVYDATMAPVRKIFVDGQERGEARRADPDMLAGCFIAVMDAVWYGVEMQGAKLGAPVMGAQMVEVFVNGVLSREGLSFR